MFIGVVVCILLRRPGSSVDMLPHSKLDCGVTSCGYAAIDHFFAEFGPETREAEHFFEENVIFTARSWPLVELTQDGHVRLQVANGLN